MNARVVDAVRAAGGSTANADLEAINLAQTVLDTEQVHVPSRSSRSRSTVAPRHRPQPRARSQTSTSTATGSTTGVIPGASGSPDAATSGEGNKVNLNTADATTLDRLPGIGPATARAIIDYRTRTGPFSSLDDLMKIDGIGPKKLAALKDAVTL